MSLSNGLNCDGKPPVDLNMAKRLAAFYCCQHHVHNGQKLGIGSGSTVKHLVDCLIERVADESLSNIVCVPTSFMTRKWLLDGGLPVSDLENTPELDLCIDGADEVDIRLNCIKGGGGCLVREKIVQSAAKTFMIIGDYRKRSSTLGDRYSKIPIEVIPFSYMFVKCRIEKDEGGECTLRMASQKMGPVITDNNNYILDWAFPKKSISDWSAINVRLSLISGVVETGLFIDIAKLAYFGMEDGTVCELMNPGDEKTTCEIVE